jgi:hypothetical protein
MVKIPLVTDLDIVQGFNKRYHAVWSHFKAELVKKTAEEKQIV